MRPSLLVPPALVVLSVATSSGVAEQAPLPEYFAKAKIIRLLLDYVEWPERRADELMVVGVLEPSPFGEHLPRALEKVVLRDGRHVKLLFFRSPAQIVECDVLLVSENHEPALGSILRTLQDKPVLTIADTPGFARRGVIVNLAILNSRVRLEVNLAAMKRSGLMISPQVLKGATIID